MDSERVLVCVSSRGPDAEGLLRKAARLADRLKAPWYALYIQTPKEAIERIDAATQRVIANTLALTQQMGGTPLTSKGTDIVSTIAVFVKEYGISHVVLGRSRPTWYQRYSAPPFWTVWCGPFRMWMCISSEGRERSKESGVRSQESGEKITGMTILAL